MWIFRIGGLRRKGDKMEKEVEVDEIPEEIHLEAGDLARALLAQPPELEDENG